MAGIIKNQILKHLSKFAKNLSHDQINLSTLKGEGELKNLELNEEVLTDLLDLPSWLRLTRADCNRVAVRIQWTKLKSVPIHLSLDEVRVEVETCENLRTVHTAQKKPSYSHGGHYGFVDKVVDGVTVTVNSVIVTLNSHVFTASFQMSRIVLESRSPNWTKADLRMTRIKDTDKQEVLIFKEMSWQTVRIEAKSTKNEDLTPLRLITNQARCRITIKKKITDCSVLGCRLVLILDDLLWVLTDDQLKAALHFADSLSGLLKRATEETQKIKGARKLESLSEFHSKSTESLNRRKYHQSCAAAQVFARYDVVETSYHFYSDRIDLHLSDDPLTSGHSWHPELKDGGAFQVSLAQLQVDFYPYHLVSGTRAAWIRYQEGVHSTWLRQSLLSFQAKLLDAVTSSTKNHSPLTRKKVDATPERKGQGQSSKMTGNGDVRGNSNDGANIAMRESILTQFRKLLTANLVVRLSNFSMWKVSTTTKSSPKEFISGIDKPQLAAKARKRDAGERERFSLPDDMPLIHFEYTQFYYPGGLDFPLPPPKFFAYINPIQISVDHLTVLWLNAFALNVQQSVKMLALEQSEPPYLDVKIEAIMLRILLEADKSAPRQKDRPRALHIQVSRILASNYRSLETGSKADLAGLLDRFQSSGLFFGTDFPNYPSDISTVCDKMMSHATGLDDNEPSVNIKLTDSPARQDVWKMMKKTLFWTDAKDVWFVHLDPVWADFHGTPSSGSRPVPLVDAFPVTLWLYKEPDGVNRDSNKPKKQQAKLNLLVSVNSLVSVQLNHFQLLFLLRMVEMIGEIAAFLNHDVKMILGEDDDSSIAVGVLVPQVDVSLLMPSANQTRDYSLAADIESWNPETSSIYSAGDFEARKTIDEEKIASALGVGNEDDDDDDDDVAENSQCSTDDTLSNARSQSELFPSDSDGESLSAPQPSPSARPNLGVNKATVQSLPTIRLSSPDKTRDNLTSSMTNMMASLDVSLRGKSRPPASPLTDDDEVSIRSDGSSDSEQFVIITQADSYNVKENFDNLLFNVDHAKRSSPVEYAVEVTEDTISDASCLTPRPVSAERPASIIEPNIPREGMISVATFHVGRLEVAHQSVSGNSAVKVQGASLSGEECTAITWEEFQSKFTMRGKGWSESTLQPPSAWCFRLRFSTKAPRLDDLIQHSRSSTMMSLREKISRAAEAFVELKVQNLPLQFFLSTLNGLGDLFEDEIIPTPIPMRINLENIALHLIEDRPSPNIGSPGSLPIDIAIPALTITRDKSGMFSIQAAESHVDPSTNVAHPSIPSSQKKEQSIMSHHLDLVRSGVASIETELHQRASLLAVENDSLRTRLEKAEADLKKAKQRAEDVDNAQKSLVEAEDRMSALEMENGALRDTLKYLQQELLKAGKKV